MLNSLEEKPIPTLREPAESDAAEGTVRPDGTLTTDIAAASHVAETVIRPTSGWRSLDLRELWRYHELLYFLTWRDIKVRYKQTVLGAAWAIIQPVMTMLVFTIFFGRLGGLEQNTHVTVAYPVFVYAALLPWQFFASSLQLAGQSLIGSANLISKVYFPRLIVPLASIGVGVVDLAISFVMMGCLMVAYGVPITLHLLALPLCLVGTLVSALGAGTLLAALTVSFRDFRYVVPFLVQIWMFASPVAYPFEVVPERWRLLYALNPMAGIISAYRSTLLGEPFHWGAISISLVSATTIFIAGILYFRRVERRFADIV
ncbi:MAG: ABC transporter permease [Planctomycetaceae bacterium]